MSKPEGFETVDGQAHTVMHGYKPGDEVLIICGGIGYLGTIELIQSTRVTLRNCTVGPMSAPDGAEADYTSRFVDVSMSMISAITHKSHLQDPVRP